MTKLALVCDAGGLDRADLATVDAVCRVVLTGRRIGCDVRLEDAPADLRALLRFVGLAEVVPCARPSGGKPRR